MTPHLREVMNTILLEARAGAFETKMAAVRRRGKLIEKLKADTAQFRDEGPIIGTVICG